jgi:PAS domain S-box-containing protein
MEDMGLLGVIFFIVGGAFIALTFGMLHFTPVFRTSKLSNPSRDETKINEKALLVISPGGRIAYLNQTARDLFGVLEHHPSLDRLARRVRPGDGFLTLCSTPGKNSFTLQGRVVLGESLEIPYDGSLSVLVSLQKLQVENQSGTGESFSDQVLEVYTDLSLAMTASLDLEVTLQTILESVEKLIPSDFPEITIWEPENNHLIPYRLASNDRPDRRIERSTDRYLSTEGYSGYLVSHKKPLLISRVDEYRELSPVVDRRQVPFNSYLGIPLIIAGELVGTLELASIEKDRFSKEEVEVLRVLSGQAAVALHNALLYREEQKRIIELSGLSKLTQAAASIHDMKDLYTSLVECIQPLLNVQVLGFWIFDENSYTLEAQIPFVGVPSDVIAISSIRIQAESSAEEILTDKELIVSSSAPEDTRLKVLNLDQWAFAAGIRSIVLAPLASHNRPFGYLMAADKTDGEFFTQEDLRLLTIISAQAAIIIENAILVLQTQKRVLRSEALRRIASLTGSTARLDEILQYSLLEIARLLQADAALILLLDGTRGKLCPHRESLFGFTDDLQEKLNYFSADISLSLFNKIKRGAPQYFLAADSFENPDMLPIYKPLFERIQIRSVINVPLVVRDRLIGEIMVGNRQPNYYDHSDLTIIVTAASQLASAIEQHLLFKQTDETLRERVDQLSSTAQKIRELAASSDLKELMEILYEETVGSARADCGSILLFNQDQQSNPFIMVQAGDPHENKLSVIETEALQQDRSILISDYQNAQTWANSSIHPPHPKVRSSLIVPITYKGEKAGLIHLHSNKSGAFNEVAQELVQNLAVQAAITAGNIHRYQNQKNTAVQLKSQAEALSQQYEQELAKASLAVRAAEESLIEVKQKDQVKSTTIYRLDQTARRIRAGLEITDIVSRKPDRLQVITGLAREIRAKMNIDVVLVAETTPGGPRLVHVAGDLPSDVRPEALLGSKNPIRHCLQTGSNLLVPDLDQESKWENSPLLQSLNARGFICLAIPLELPGASVLGEEIDRSSRYIELEEAAVDAVLLGTSLSPLAPFTPEDVQLYTLLTRQVAIALQNQRLLYETNRRLREVNLLLDFSRKLGSLDPLEILQTLLESALMVAPSAQAGMVIMWNPEEACLIPQAAQGYPENELLLEIRFQPGQTIPGRVFEDGFGLIVDEVEFAVDYEMPLEQLVRYRYATGGRLPASTLVVPISAGSRMVYETDLEPGKTSPLGVLVLENFHMASAFTQEDQALVTSLSQQTALTLENARLYQASEQRSIQLQTLTEVSATITSSLQSSDLNSSLLDHVSTILPYDTGTLWIRKGDLITIYAARGFMDQEERAGLSVKVEDSELLKEMVQTGKPIVVGDTSTDARFTSLVEPEFFSWLGIPLISKGQVAGVIALEKAEKNFYSGEQIQAATTFAGQAAVALENARLYEESVQRAQELDQRSQRLALLNRLSSELSSSMDPDYILRLTLQELVLATECSAVSGLFIDPNGQVWVHAESPQTTLSLPGLLPHAPLFERIRESLGIYTVDDLQVGEEQNSLLAPLSEYLASRSTVSLCVLPLFTGSDLHGLIFIHKDEPHHYSQEEVELARTISNQAAAAVQNARLFAQTQLLYAETRRRSNELTSLYDMGMSISQILDIDPLIDVIFEHLSSLIKFDTCAMVLVDEAENLNAYVIEHGEKVGPLSLERKGASFSEYVLKEGRPLLIGDIDKERKTLPVPGMTYGDPVKSWFGIPLVVRGSSIGVLSVQSDNPGQFGEEHQRLVGQVGSQLAIALDNARLFSTVQKYTSELELRVAERTAQLAKEHKRTETLLGVIKELSTSLDIDIVLNRTLLLINEATSAERSEIILARPEENDLHLFAACHSPIPNLNKPSISLQGTSFSLAEEVLAKGEAVLVADLSKDYIWNTGEEGSSDKPLSALAVPLQMGEETLGALLLYYNQPGQFLPDRTGLVEAMAKQIAVTINNARLFQLIRDQAGRLGDMLRQQHVETSRSQAILEAVADGVLVTDSSRIITLFNKSAEQISGLDRRSLLGNSLDHFSGLFGKAAKTWVETVRTWSEDPSSYHSGDIFTQQIEMDDRRVISVHLSPVHLHQDFLGTVSTFRDITHQVEVDRLKSEFVATVSHELRTPMTSIKGYVEILLMGAAGNLNEQQSHFLDIVKENTERLSNLVNDLLDVSRIEAGKIELSLCPLDVIELVEKAVSDITGRSSREGKTMSIEVHTPQVVPRVLGDQERVRQIMDNLLENAYAYTPAEGSITINILKAEPGVQIDIIDTGIGILPKDQPRIFERFYRGEAPLVLSTSGTGLGLSIVERLIDMHKGRIWFSSSGIPGEGSTFSFVLPCYVSKD